MSKRSRAREVALQLLFQFDANAKASGEAVEPFARMRLREPGLVKFCMALYQGVTANVKEIDRRLALAAENWRVPRMAAVDRNVLRMGAYELLFQPDTPPVAAIDEAIELARRYGSADSSSFVNGVLDRMRREIAGEPPPSEPPPAEPPSAEAEK